MNTCPIVELGALGAHLKKKKKRETEKKERKKKNDSPWSL